MNREHQESRRARRAPGGVLFVGRFLIVLSLYGVIGSPPGAAAEAAGAPTLRQVEGAVNHGFRWLAATQIKEGPDAGSWPSPHFRRAGASFAGLALLAGGVRPGVGEYGEVLDRAMTFVMAGMDSSGYLGEQYESGMYMHAICSLFGLSYLGCSSDPKMETELSTWCHRSLDCIVKAQSVPKDPVARGGWRYTPDTRESDLSVTACLLQVLHAARQAGFEIEDKVFAEAISYINRAYSVTESGLAGFLYRPGVSLQPELAVTGVALYIKHLLEREADERSRIALAYLRGNPPVWSGRSCMGYFYLGNFYIAQGMFQVGGEAWAEFSPLINALLIQHQREDGHWPLPPDNAEQTQAIGSVYPTAMAILILSLEKQYLPVYQRQKQLF